MLFHGKELTHLSAALQSVPTTMSTATRSSSGIVFVAITFKLLLIIAARRLAPLTNLFRLLYTLLSLAPELRGKCAAIIRYNGNILFLTSLPEPLAAGGKHERNGQPMGHKTDGNFQ